MDTKKLRQKILDLAIHGKLVPQDPNDEPASVLLERIKAEKEQLIKEGKIKRQKKSASSDTSHYGNIPDEWCEAPMSELFILNPKSKLADESLCGFIPMSLVEDGFSGRHYFETRNWGQVKKGFSQFQNGDIGIAKISPCFENLKSVIFENLPNGNGAGTTELTILRSLGVYSKFYLYLFKSGWYISEGTKYFKGVVGQQRVNKEIFTDLIVPLPPLNEQKRIVEEIDRYFALVDVLEQNEYDLKDAVQKAKSKILDLALSGRLTSDTSHYPKLPDGWGNKDFSQLFEVLTSKSYQIQQKEIHQSGKYPVISQSALYIEGYSDIEEKLYNAETPVIIFGDHTRNVKYVNFDFIVGADGVKILKPTINSKFAYYLTLYNSKQIENRGYSRHFQYLKQQSWSIPSEKEQQKIVEIIEHYFRVFDIIITELGDLRYCQ